jgi:very-short-patch-repair endonuclease
MDYEKSFASHEKSKFWSKKNPISPEQVSKNSRKKYLFDCICGHEISITLNNVSSGFWCPYCSIPCKKLCKNNECVFCFEKSFASHEKSKFWSCKNTVVPRNILKGTNKKYLFDCKTCLHTFEKSINQITSKNTFCGYCSITHPLFCGIKECEFCFNRSFDKHEKSKFWSKKNTIESHQVSLQSNEKFYFDCDKCNHTFEASLNNITAGGWCSYCNGDKLCENTECKYCFDKSFASNPLSSYWSKKNSTTPRNVHLKSNTKYWFMCFDCNHQFERPLYKIANNVNHHCPYCIIPSKLLCNDNNCKNCFEKSFASHKKSIFWSNKNKITPRNVFKNSNNKYWFICSDCNYDFENTLNHISGRNDWCPNCKNKTEKKMYELLKINYNIERQFKEKWCKKKRSLPFDFCIIEHNIIIELDGRQHFEQVSNWSSPEEQQNNDLYKQLCANKNNYSIIRLLQEDVLYDKYDWLFELQQNIEKIKNDTIVQNIYMCKNCEYVNFQNKSNTVFISS